MDGLSEVVRVGIGVPKLSVGCFLPMVQPSNPAGKKLKACCRSTISKGGRMLMIVEAFHYQPLASWYTKNSAVDALTWTEELLELLPVGGLLIFELGFFNLMGFDGFTDTEKLFVTEL